MRFEKLKIFVEKKLREELPLSYSYHSFQHTQDVLSACIRIAEAEQIDEQDTELIKVAALLHDIGFIRDFKDHERISCEIAKEILLHYDYSSIEILKICGMILATAIPQQPNNKLEEILCDADLDYLGRTDFWEIGGFLFEELKHLKVLSTEEEWNRLQVNFLEKHRYFTNYSIELRESIKLSNLNTVKSKLNG